MDKIKSMNVKWPPWKGSKKDDERPIYPPEEPVTAADFYDPSSGMKFDGAAGGNGDGAGVMNYERDHLFPEVADARQPRNVRVKEFLIFSSWMRFFYLFVLLVIIGFVIPLLVDEFAWQDAETDDHIVRGTCHIEIGMRTDCMPERDTASETECLKRGCCYQELNEEYGAPICHHTIPSTHMLNFTGSSIADGYFPLRPAYEDVYETTIEDFPLFTNPTLQQRQMAEGHIRLSLYDGDNPPDDVDEGETGSDLEGVRLQIVTTNPDYADDDRFRLKLTREDTGALLFDCSYGATVLGSAMSEVSLFLPRDQIYGLAGMDVSFTADTDFASKTIYSYDPYVMSGMQHLHPSFYAMDIERRFFGVMVESDSPMAIEVSPGVVTSSNVATEPLIVFRSMGGALKLHVFTGPTPHDVGQQLSNHVGLPRVPPRWAMGYHLCRRTTTYFGFDASSDEMEANNLPYDSDCVDERLQQFAFTLDDRETLDLPSVLARLRRNDKRLMLNLPAQTLLDAQPYDACAGENCFIQSTSGRGGDLVGVFEEANVTLPDFTAAAARDWWQQQLVQFVSDNGMCGVVGGITLTRNSPYLASVDCGNGTEDAFPYVPKDIREVFNSEEEGRTACGGAEHAGGVRHYSVHNAYSSDMMEATVAQEVNGVDFHFNKHSGPGVSTMGGVFISDMQPSWNNLRHALREMLELNLAGVPMVSMSGCGVYTMAPLNTSLIVDDLCLRWYMLASAMPAMHSFYGTEENSRMPYNLAGSYMDWIRRAMDHRYRLMPYMHTVMYEAAELGLPAVRPLFFEFPEEQRTYNVYEQFMFGDALLFSPIVDFIEGSQISAFFPFGSWYELWSGLRIEGDSDFVMIEDIPYQIPVHIRAGKIIPILSTSNLTVDTSYATSEYDLFVALACDIQPRNSWSFFDFFASTSNTCSSAGTLRLPSAALSPADDPAVTLTAVSTVDSGQLTIGNQALQSPQGAASWCVDHSGSENTVVSGVVIYGLAEKPAFLTVPWQADPIPVASEDYSQQVFYEADLDRLQATDLQLDICSDTNNVISWTFEDDDNSPRNRY